MPSGIYKITNLINNKCYIGKSKNIEDRFKYHKDNYKCMREYNGETARQIWKNEYQSIYKSFTGFRDMLQAKSLDEEIILNGSELT